MRPLHTDPRLSKPGHAEDHLAFMVNPAFYSSHTLMLVLCDSAARPVAHFEVMDCDSGPTPSECSVVLDNLIEAATIHAEQPLNGLALAITRPGSEQFQLVDHIWFRAFHRICHARGLRGHGVYVVGTHGARAVNVDDAA